MRLLDLLEATNGISKWFGDSQVVDKNGDPLVLYHGTSGDFDTFNGMVWGSVGTDIPNEYADMRHVWHGGSANVIPLYMRVIKPFNADYLPKTVTVAEVFTEMIEQSGINPDSIAEQIQKNWNIVETGRREEESGPSYNRHDFWADTRSFFGNAGANAIKSTFELLGFDGVKMIEGGELTYGAFSPNQVKSIYNNGEFDTNTDNISEANLFEQPLMELRGYVVDGANSKDGQIIAWRGYYWVLPSYNDMNDVSEDVLFKIARTIGMDAYEEHDDGDVFMDLLSELAEERPDIIWGQIHDGVLYYQPTGAGAQSPITSSMVKKLVHALGLIGAEIDGVDWYGNEDNSYISKREMTGKLPEILFHGTTSDYMTSIARTGIRPNINLSNWKGQNIEHDKLIFGATTLEGATFHANRTAKMQFDPNDNYPDPEAPFPVILEFKVPDPNLIVPDYDVASDTIGYTNQTSNLGYSNIPDYGKYSNSDELVKKNPEGRLWKSASVFGYAGRVPPSHIIRVYTNFFNGSVLTSSFDWSGSLKEFFEEWDDQVKQWYGEFDE